MVVTAANSKDTLLRALLTDKKKGPLMKLATERADVYLCARVSGSKSSSWCECLMCVCVCDGAPHVALTPDLAAPSPRLTARTDGKDLPREETLQHTHTQTWCALQELPWRPLTRLSVQQWLMPRILSHQVSVFVSVNLAGSKLW